MKKILITLVLIPFLGISQTLEDLDYKDGKIGQYLNEEFIHIILTKEKMRNRPEITSKFISDSLISIKNDTKSWTIKKINE